jgi:hypothetical protein
MIDYVGGGSKFVYESEPTYIKSDAAFTIKQFNKESYLYLADAAVTSGAAEPNGAVTTLTNEKGTSVKAATTGVAAVALTTSAANELKTGDYTIVAASASTINVYCDSDVDFSGVFTGGTAKRFNDDTLLLNAAPLSITTGGTTALSGFGIEFTGGSGTIGMTIGDSATFSVRAANVVNEVITIGADTTFFPAYSISAYSVPKGMTGEVLSIYMPTAQVSGIDLNLKEYAFGTASPKIKVLQSQSENMVATIRRIQRSLA